MNNFKSDLNKVLELDRPVIAITGSRVISDTERSDLLKLIIKCCMVNPNILWTSGGADGTDEVLEEAMKVVSANGIKCSSSIYLPWNGYNDKYNKVSGDHKYYNTGNFSGHGIDELLVKYYVNFRNPNIEISSGVSKLMSRNSYIFLDEDLNNPVDMSICIADVTKVNKSENRIMDAAGGTGYGVRLCYDLNIPCYNLRYEPHYSDIKSLL